MIKPQANKQNDSQGRTTSYSSEDIPKELRRRTQWIVWRLEEHDGKPTKIPYNPKDGKRASSTDLITWGTFFEALEALETGQYSGIGFVFCSADPYTGIDLDKCRNSETGELTSEAQSIVDAFEGAYTEVSPSGTGVHIIVRGKLPEKGKRRGWIEAYTQDRYFTITGRALGSRTVPRCSQGSIGSVSQIGRRQLQVRMWGIGTPTPLTCRMT